MVKFELSEAEAKKFLRFLSKSFERKCGGGENDNNVHLGRLLQLSNCSLKIIFRCSLAFVTLIYVDIAKNLF